MIFLSLMIGGNNLGFAACEVYWSIRADVATVHAHFARARVVVMSMYPGVELSPGREAKKAIVDAELRANAGRDYIYTDIFGPIESFCDRQEHCSLYLPDNIHFSREGYVFLGGLLRDFIARSRLS